VANAAPRRADIALLAVFGAFTLAVVAGYATFGRHPELLATMPSAAGAYGTALRLLPMLHVWIAFAVLAAYLVRATGTRWTGAFALLYVISLSSELLGTGYGIPFGEYHYTPMLGAEWLARVPVVIPLSWFSMSVASYGIARQALGHSATPRSWMPVLLGSLLLLCWDLALDPAMSHATFYWVWGAHGPYYGMPWSNLAGWYITGGVLITVLVLTGGDAWVARLSPRWLTVFYGTNLFLALGMDLAANLWLALGATLLALAATYALMRAGRGRAPRREPARTPATLA
jgi:putative membrane protein